MRTASDIGAYRIFSSGLDNGLAWNGDGPPPSYGGWGDYIDSYGTTYATPEANGGTSYYSPSAGGFVPDPGGGAYTSTPLITYGGGADFGGANAVGVGSAGGGGGGLASGIGTVANIAAVVPGLNVPASLVSAGVSIFQGNYVQAGIAAAGIIPFVADFSEAARVTKEGVTLYRAVSHAEHAELLATNVFKTGPNSLGGKFFAESAEHAAQWGDKFEGTGNYKIISATFPKSATDSLMRWDRLDGIGPARYGELNQINAAKPVISTIKQ